MWPTFPTPNSSSVAAAAAAAAAAAGSQHHIQLVESNEPPTTMHSALQQSPTPALTKRAKTPQPTSLAHPAISLASAHHPHQQPTYYTTSNPATLVALPAAPMPLSIPQLTLHPPNIQPLAAAVTGTVANVTPPSLILSTPSSATVTTNSDNFKRSQVSLYFY